MMIDFAPCSLDCTANVLECRYTSHTQHIQIIYGQEYSHHREMLPF